MKTLLILKPVLPEFLAASILFRLTTIKLQLEDRKDESNIAISKYKYGAKSSLCLSVDFDLPTSKVVQGDWRQASIQILHLLEKYDLSISWGICGKLALSEPKVFRQIIDSSVHHDIGAHTFTHINFSKAHCTPDVARDEVLKCVEFLEKVQRPVTFIFPWNRVKYLDILRELGFITFRGNRKTQLTYPYKQDELWNIPQTYYLTEKSVNEVNFIKKLMDFAIAYNCVVHVWSHLWNMTIKGDAIEFADKVMKPLLSYAKQKQNEGSLWMCTMRELANYCEARENCRIDHIEKTEDKISFSAYCKIDDSRFDFPPILTLKIRIPRKWKSTKVFVDNIEQERGFLCFIARRNLRRYVFLTLTFEKPCYKIHLVQTLKA